MRDLETLVRLISRRRPIHEIYAGVHETLSRFLPAPNLFVALDAGQDRLRFPFFHDEILRVDYLDMVPLAGLTGYVIRNNERLWIKEWPEALTRIGFRGTPPVDWIGIPIHDRDGRAFGALVAQTYKEGIRYDERQVDTLSVAAELLSIALQTADLERERSVARLATLVEETEDIEGLYAGIHSLVAGIIPSAADSFIIARIDRAEKVFHQVYCVDEWEKQDASDWSLDEGLSGFVAAGEAPSFIFELGTTPEPEGFRVVGFMPAYWLGAQIRFGSAVQAVVMIQSYDPRKPISREDEYALVEICPHIATAIARVEFMRHARGQHY